MNARIKLRKDIPDTAKGEGHVIRISLGYQLGGLNYFTGDNEPRAYYLHISPTEVFDGGYRTVLTGSTKEAGFKIRLKETKRRSQPKMNELWEALEPRAEQMAKAFTEGEYSTVNHLAQEAI